MNQKIAGTVNTLTGWVTNCMGTVNTLTEWVTNCMGTVNTLTVPIQYTFYPPHCKNAIELLGAFRPDVEKIQYH
jgi:hypothetical protein